MGVDDMSIHVLHHHQNQLSVTSPIMKISDNTRGNAIDKVGFAVNIFLFRSSMVV